MRVMVCVLVAVSLLGSAAVAQTKDRLTRRDQLVGFEAVGRLDGPDGYCTGVLIARDVVLTAAHCITSGAEGLVFRLGYRGGKTIATQPALRVVVSQAYGRARANGDRETQLANDLALVQLAAPVHAAGVNPYRVSALSPRGTGLTVASFGRGRSDALTLERGCVLNQIYRGDIIGLNCEATFGSSGAPVFVERNGRTSLVAIVSAVAPTETLGVTLKDRLPALQTRLRDLRAAGVSVSTARRIKREGTASGPRFVRP